MIVVLKTQLQSDSAAYLTLYKLRPLISYTILFISLRFPRHLLYSIFVYSDFIKALILVLKCGKFELKVELEEKTAVISRRHPWFPLKMTSEKRAEKFYTDEALLPRSW